MWGTDMPNVERFCNYRQTLDTFRVHCRGLISDVDIDNIVGGTTARLFGRTGTHPEDDVPWNSVLRGRVALVGGSSRGIGRAVAVRLAQEGARVVICARGGKALRATADEIRARTGADVLALAADVRSAGGRQRGWSPGRGLARSPGHLGRQRRRTAVRPVLGAHAGDVGRRAITWFYAARSCSAARRSRT